MAAGTAPPGAATAPLAATAAPVSCVPLVKLPWCIVASEPPRSRSSVRLKAEYSARMERWGEVMLWESRGMRQQHAHACHRVCSSQQQATALLRSLALTLCRAHEGHGISHRQQRRRVEVQVQVLLARQPDVAAAGRRRERERERGGENRGRVAGRVTGRVTGRRTTACCGPALAAPTFLQPLPASSEPV